MKRHIYPCDPAQRVGASEFVPVDQVDPDDASMCGWCVRVWRSRNPELAGVLPTKCSIDGCGRPAKARGWCKMHHRRWRRYGDPSIVRQRRIDGTPQERFRARFHESESGCWIWDSVSKGNGYGVLTVNGERMLAHRFSFEMHRGPIPDGLVIDHLCHTRDTSCPGGDSCPHRACVNPDHLELVTPLENARRGRHKMAGERRSAAITHCRHGHEYTPENTFVRGNGKRQCRKCMERWQQASQSRKGDA